jgi:Trypsin
LFYITLGSVDLDDQNKVTMTSTKSVIHENFNPTTMNNDVAIVILRNKITFS